MKKAIFFTIILFSIASCMENKSGKEQEQKNKLIIQKFYDEVINAHKTDLIDSLVTEDFIDHQYEPENPNIGSKGLKESAKVFFASYPDIHIKVHFMLEQGDTVISKVTMTGTNSGAGMPSAANKQINVDGVAIFVLKNNKIWQRWRFFDDVGMMNQLGMLPQANTDSAK